MQIQSYYFLAQTAIIVVLSETVQDTCEKGQYLKGDKCETCPPGTFMNEEHHMYKECIPCKTAENHISGEELVKNCTPFADSVFKCVEGFYVGWDRQCHRCSVCEKQGKVEKRSCSEKKNTVCCDKPDMIAINDTCVSVTNSSATDPPMPTVNVTSVANLTTVTPTSNANATEPSKSDSNALRGGEIAMIVLAFSGVVFCISIGLCVVLVMKGKCPVRLVRNRLRCRKSAEAANGGMPQNVRPPREERRLMPGNAEDQV